MRRRRLLGSPMYLWPAPGWPATFLPRLPQKPTQRDPPAPQIGRWPFLPTLVSLPSRPRPVVNSSSFPPRNCRSLQSLALDPFVSPHLRPCTASTSSTALRITSKHPYNPISSLSQHHHAGQVRRRLRGPLLRRQCRRRADALPAEHDEDVRSRPLWHRPPPGGRIPARAGRLRRRCHLR